MLSLIKNFFAKEDGAVTVEWVVLCAAVVGLGVSGVNGAQQGVNNLAKALESGISTKSVENGD